MKNTPPSLPKEVPAYQNAYRNGLGLVAFSCILSFAPNLGVLMLLAAPLAIIIGIILSIITMAKGGAAEGIVLLLFSVVVAPVIMFIGSMFSASMLLDDISAERVIETARENRILEEMAVQKEDA